MRRRVAASAAGIAIVLGGIGACGDDEQAADPGPRGGLSNGVTEGGTIAPGPGAPEGGFREIILFIKTKPV